VHSHHTHAWQIKHMKEQEKRASADLATANGQLGTLEQEMVRCKAEILKSQGEMTALRKENSSLNEQLKLAKEVCEATLRCSSWMKTVN
jgi:peptidoglycan hydrolase CwlO-like protein